MYFFSFSCEQKNANVIALRETPATKQCRKFGLGGPLLRTVHFQFNAILTNRNFSRSVRSFADVPTKAAGINVAFCPQKWRTQAGKSRCFSRWFKIFHSNDVGGRGGQLDLQTEERTDFGTTASHVALSALTSSSLNHCMFSAVSTNQNSLEPPRSMLMLCSDSHPFRITCMETRADSSEGATGGSKGKITAGNNIPKRKFLICRISHLIPQFSLALVLTLLLSTAKTCFYFSVNSKQE